MPEQSPIDPSLLEKLHGELSVPLDEPMRVVNILRSVSRKRRATAAWWIGRLGFRTAIEALTRAVLFEWQDIARAAMLDTLNSFAVPTIEVLTPAQLLHEATTRYKHDLPATLAWFPFAHVPDIHWAHIDEIVPREIIRWWIVESALYWKSHPRPMAGHYGALLREDERKKLGYFIVECWLARKTVPRNTYAEAMELTSRSYKNARSWQPDLLPAEIVRRSLHLWLNERVCVSHQHRGMLSLAGVFGDAILVPLVARFMNYYAYSCHAHGDIKAMLYMLSASRHPLVFRLMYEFAKHWRNAFEREVAQGTLRHIAATQGTTIEDLLQKWGITTDDEYHLRKVYPIEPYEPTAFYDTLTAREFITRDSVIQGQEVSDLIFFNKYIH